ncbi:unnamed protein product [Rotaria socialis]|uniref:Uncharacterized protein n=1 Tax=Rotaria socialis TaxID=392032 RepID=A0A818MAV4_9BILA|nr:unnamed protein product [Rotaria socialis]CAF4492497.1 unnamed protein product [Rotaria socialis]
MKLFICIVVSIISLIAIFYLIFIPIKINKSQLKKIKQQLEIIEDDKLLIKWNSMVHEYLKFPLANDYGSHSIVLLAALCATKSGPILELGMGTSSSPLLHRLALEQKRFLLSADSDRRWINYFSSFAVNNTLHELKYVEIKSEMGIEWATSNLEEYRNWTVVFIDHRPGSRRQFDLMSYSHRSDVVILHDTESSAVYQYDRALSLYPYKYRFSKLRPYTDVLSVRNEKLINVIRRLLETTPDYYFSNITLNKNF